MDDDGFLEQTSWTAADDGFLVIDLNADGSQGAGDNNIDQSNELVLSTLGEDGDTDLQALAELAVAKSRAAQMVKETGTKHLLYSALGLFLSAQFSLFPNNLSAQITEMPTPYCSASPLAISDATILLRETEFFRFAPFFPPEMSDSYKIMLLESRRRLLLRLEVEEASLDKAKFLFEMTSFLYWRALMDITDNNPQIREIGPAYVDGQQMAQYFPEQVPLSYDEISGSIMCFLRCDKQNATLSQIIENPHFLNCLEKEE